MTSLSTMTNDSLMVRSSLKSQFQERMCVSEQSRVIGTSLRHENIGKYFSWQFRSQEGRIC